jgi:hypothetical protein
MTSGAAKTECACQAQEDGQTSDTVDARDSSTVTLVARQGFC